MKKTLFTSILLLLTLIILPVFAQDCIPPDCPTPYGQEVAGDAVADGFKKVGDDNTGALGEFFGGSHYSAKGTEKATGLADSTGHSDIESMKTASDFMSRSTTSLRNNATAEGIIGPGVVSEDGRSRQATWGEIGDNMNYAYGSEEAIGEEASIVKTNPTGIVSVWGKTSAIGKTEGKLLSGDNFRQSNISNFGSSNADGGNSRISLVNGNGEIGAGSYIAKGTSSALADLHGTWCYNGNVYGEGDGVGYTRTEIKETATSLDVSSHSEATVKAKTTNYE